MAVQRGRSERRGESYFVPYVEPLSDARTKLAAFFSILLNRILEHRLRANGLGQHTPLLQLVHDPLGRGI